ncbi:MAG TPA: DUF6504 family protein [Limnochordales bacterium]
MDVKGRFIGEPIEVDPATMVPTALPGGGPACPGRFRWRGRTYHVARVLEQGRRLSHEGYVRQHRFRVETTDGMVAVIACDRRVKRRVNPWQLLAIEKPSPDEA